MSVLIILGSLVRSQENELFQYLVKIGFSLHDLCFIKLHLNDTLWVAISLTCHDIFYQREEWVAFGLVGNDQSASVEQFGL